MSTMHKHWMLRCIAAEPRTRLFFTESTINAIAVSLAPRIVDGYLAQMIEEAWIREEDGKYHITRHGKAVLNRPTTKAEPRVWCAASTKGAYVPPKMGSPRAAADDHKRHRSLPMGV